MRVAKTCSVEGCTRSHTSRGFCSYHYHKFRGTDKVPAAICSVDGCSKPMHGKGLCVRHYRQKVRTGSVIGRAYVSATNRVESG